MGKTGIGVMIRQLSGNAESVAAFTGAVNKRIAHIYMTDDVLTIKFDDGYILHLKDDGQSCCEHRYMKTDDTLSDFIGGVMTGAEVVDAPNQSDEYSEHEVQFLRVHTDKGILTVSNHNEHNGYYGGFYIQASTGHS